MQGLDKITKACVTVKKIETQSLKTEIASSILRSLPNWFGIEESVCEYITESSRMPFFAAFEDNSAVGFVSIKKNDSYTAEIYVIGVKNFCHRKGIGRKLFNACYKWCKDNGFNSCR